MLAVLFAIMFVLFHLLRSKYFWLMLAVVTAGLLCYGFYLNQRQGDAAGTVQASELVAQLAEENPAAYQRMQALASQYGDRTVAASAAFYEDLYQQSALSALVRDLAPEKGEAAAVVQLASLSLAGRGQLSGAAQDYLTLLAARRADKSLLPEQQKIMAAYTAQFIQDQQRAQQEGGATWTAVCQHPFSTEIYRTLKMNEATQSAAVWDYYRDRVAWLGDALLLLSLYDVQIASPEGEVSLTAPEVYKNYIELCERYPSMAAYTESLIKQWQSELDAPSTPSEQVSTLPSEELAAHIPVIYAMYREYGDAIESIHTQTQAPPSECVDVLLANAELYEQAQQEGSESRFLHDVVSLHKLDKEVWTLIGMESNALLLYQAHRDKARDVLVQYAPDGITHLIMHASRNEANVVNLQSVYNGIEALARYKEIALYVLDRYGSDHRFERVLARDFRSVIYLAAHEQEGMNHLASEDWRGYLDKELTAAGDLKQGSWLEYLPGGALYRMAKNMQQGYPSSWDELGWASVEVAEIVFAVASLGASTAVTTTGKTAVKATVKSASAAATKASSRALHRAALRGATRQEATQAFARASVLRGTSRFLSGKLLRARGVLASSLRIGATVFRPVKFAASGMTRVWRAVPAGMRKKLFRVTAVALVGVELYYRAWPHRGEIFDGFAQSLANLSAQVVAGSIPSLRDLGTAAGVALLQLMKTKEFYAFLAVLILLLALYLLGRKMIQTRFRKKTI